MLEKLDKQSLDFGGRVLQNLPKGMTMAVAKDWQDNPEFLGDYLAGLSVSPFVVKVDRSVKPIYPDWMEKLLHPELETTGSAEFNLADVSLWLHEGQQNGGVTIGNPIYEHLRDKDMLETCLNLQDGLAIQKKGIAVFRKFFGGKAVFLWKSVVQDRGGGLSVPDLCEYDGQVVVGWRWLDDSFCGGGPALRFGK